MTTGAEAVVLEATRKAAWRLTLTTAARAAGHAVLWLFCALVIIAVLGTVAPVPVVSWRAALAAAILLALVVGALVMLLARAGPATAARELDARLRLDERASTALELTLAPQVSSLGRRVIDDAGARLAGADIRAAIPWRLSRRLGWIPVLMLVVAIWPLYVTGLAIPGTPAHRARQIVRQEGAQLERFARQMEAQARAQRLPQARRTAPQVRDLGLRLQQDRVDRAGALARINELSRQVEAARQRIDQQLDEIRQPRTPVGLPPDLLRRQALQRQIRQLQELTARLRQEQSPAPRDILQRLGAITREGEGTQSAQVQQQLRQARRQLEEGDIAGAGESLTEALRQLEGLQTMLADRERLEAAQEQLERSRAAIASGRPGSMRPEGEQSAEEEGAVPAAPGDGPVEPQEGAERPAPPEGPREGSTPGAGRLDDKLGPPTPRLEAERAPQRVQGAQSEGEVSASEVIGAGRQGTSRVPVG